jgi:hypothetical protein
MFVCSHVRKAFMELISEIKYRYISRLKGHQLVLRNIEKRENRREQKCFIKEMQ